MEELIPDKFFFKIGEVAQITSLRPSVLRYWETEFEILKPNKSRSGQRLYTKKELELILEIKKLLYSEKLTIEGARKKLTNRRSRWRESKVSETEFNPDITVKVINEVIEELKKIKNSL
jgi:DNA-binding transcriptional MerR regulator